MKRKLPPTEKIIALYEGGLSQSAIAKMYDVSPSAVVYQLKKRGYTSRDLAQAHKLAYESGRKIPSVKSGEDHWLWKGGKARRPYRDVVKKVECASCGGKDNLSIHHIDFDHYNNAPENLRVLCVGCHMSLHKRAYWEAIRNGDAPLKSNGPIGWEHE